MAKTDLGKRNNIKDITLPDFKTDCKTTEIKLMWQ